MANGKPMPAIPYEPGDRKPLTKWLELRVLAIEMLIQLILAADRMRADDLDVDPLSDGVDVEIERLELWAGRQIEPDVARRETIAMILQARVILMETHTWPLVEMEELNP